MNNYKINNKYNELNNESNDELNNINDESNNINNINNENNNLPNINKYYNESDDNFNIWDISSIFKYILSKPIEFLLLISVFIIIYSVDYISRLNSTIYGASQSFPFIGQSQTQSPMTQAPMQMFQQKRKRKQK
jgi:hypothetical protein